MGQLPMFNRYNGFMVNNNTFLERRRPEAAGQDQEGDHEAGGGDQDQPARPRQVPG